MAEYVGPERRGSVLTEEKVQLMIEQTLASALKSHEVQITSHMDKQFAELKASFALAFPMGDPHGHRIAHEKAIRDATAWDRIKADAIGKVITGGFLVAVGWLALAVWEAFKHEVKR
jgi:hypothetical protein